ncbi:MAG: hypothetical protein AMXMBFR59_06670 [Rhodanobacteraceae bacterium]
MKRRVVGAALMLAAAAASAGQRSDYAWEWPLRLAREDGGAYRVVLSEAIYRTAQDRGLADIEVFNAAGESLPATLLGPEGASAQEWPLERLDIPWFPLPGPRSTSDADWRLRAERDAHGRVLRIDTSLAEGRAPDVLREVLLDLSQVRMPLAALQLIWSDDVAAFQTNLNLSASDDLQHWRPVGNGYIADLRNGEERLRRDRIALGPERGYRYLRIASTNAQLPALRAVRAETAPPPPEAEWRWLSVAGEIRQDGDRSYYAYRLDGRIPTQQVDARAEGGNSVATWTVSSRDDPALQWTVRAGPWTGYQVTAGEAVERSAPQRLGAAVRDREWRVDAAPAPNAPPTLELGYRPEVLVFLAQGEGPYTIAAGSATARRRDAPIGTLLDALQRRHGSAWKPNPAVPEPGRLVSGDAALRPPPPPKREPDWRNLLLWIVLVAGTLLVVGMALSLLRPKPDA